MGLPVLGTCILPLSKKSSLLWVSLEPRAGKEGMRLNPHESYIKQRLTMLAKPGILAEWIDRQNKLKFINRVFVMGCGRSGTWLLTGVMNTYQATKVLPYEMDVAYFGLVDCDEDTLV